MPGMRVLVASVLLLVALDVPVSVMAAGGPAPGGSCVPGTVWEDPASGVKYLCIYDEVFGGPRWVLMSAGQTGKLGDALSIDGERLPAPCRGPEWRLGGWGGCGRAVVSLAVHEWDAVRPACRRAPESDRHPAVRRRRLAHLPR